METDAEIALALAADRPAMDADIAAGRVLYCTGKSPHLGGCWAFMQDIAQTVNAVMKVRKPRNLRVLITYDSEK